MEGHIAKKIRDHGYTPGEDSGLGLTQAGQNIVQVSRERRAVQFP